MKRIASLFLALLLCLTIAPAVALPTAAADDNVPINDATFPDPVFQAWVRENADADGDGTLNAEEREDVTFISLSEKKVADMTGLQYFPCLYELDVSDNYLTALDVSGNPELEYLTCVENQLTYLDVTNNPYLETLYIAYNDIDTIDLSCCPYLRELDAGYTLLTYVDLSGCPELSEVDLSCCERLTGVDVRDNPNLRYLYCGGCELKELDVSYNPKLEILYVHNNLLTELDLTQNHKLRGLYTYNNPLTVVDLRGCPGLADVVELMTPREGHYGDDYYLEYSRSSTYLRISLTGQEVLTKVPITSAYFPDETFRQYVGEHFDLDGDGSLSRQEAKRVTELNLGSEYEITDLTGLCYLPELETLNVSRTGVTELDVSRCTELRELDVTHTPLKALDIFNCEYLLRLYCNDTDLAYLDISNNGGMFQAKNAQPVNLTDDLTGNTYWHYYNTNYTGDVEYILDMDPDMTVSERMVDKPVILAQPQNVSAMLNETVQFHVEAQSASDYSDVQVWYRWQYNAGSGWKNSGLTGSDTDTLSVKATSARSGYRYRCVVTDSFGKKAVTHAATLKVLAKPTITAQPADKTAAADTTVKFTVKATGGDLTYQWYYKAPGGSWAKTSLTGSKTATLTVKATAARSGYQYKCKVSNAAGYVYSSAATLTVASKPVITTQPKDKTAYTGATVKFTVKADGAETYQWYYKTPTGSWTKSTLTGATTATLTVKATAARNGYQYKCRVSSASGYVYSSAVTLTVSAKPVITNQPKSQNADAGATVKFTVKADGATAYQWYYRTSSTGTWTRSTLTGCTTATLTVKATLARNGYQYKCKVSNDAGCVYSSAATLTVTG